jgi:hypothetical protein|eukprot:7318139-Prymnesium_polylepis.1
MLNRTELYCTVAAAEPPQHRNLVCNLLAPIGHADAQKAGVWLAGDAMKGLIELCVHAVAGNSVRRKLNLKLLLQGQHPADGGKATNRMNAERHSRAARVCIVRWGWGAAELRVIPMARKTTAMQTRSPLATLS